MAGGVEVQKVAIAKLTQKPSDSHAGRSDRVGEVLMGQADGESVSLGCRLGEFTFEQVQKFNETIFHAAMAGNRTEGFTLLKASDHLTQNAFHQFG